MNILIVFLFFWFLLNWGWSVNIHRRLQYLELMQKNLTETMIGFIDAVEKLVKK